MRPVPPTVPLPRVRAVCGRPTLSDSPCILASPHPAGVHLPAPLRRDRLETVPIPVVRITTEVMPARAAQ